MLLQGIVVVDFTTLLPGPYAAQRLAQLGASVIKIEPPGGDPARHRGPQVDGVGAVYLANNRGKRSVELDLKTEAGRDAALALVAEADVLMEGFRPGVMRKLGLDYETLRQQNPQLIYCSLTGYGQTGELAHLAGHDLNYLAVSGVLAQLRDSHGRPIQPSLQLGDLIGAIAACEAILAGLVQRHQTGKGTYLDVSITNALSGLLTHHPVVREATGYAYGIPELNGTCVCYHLYETKDGGTASLGALEPKFWRKFCEAVERLDWLPAQFSPAEDGQPVYEEIKRLFQSRTLAEWADLGRAADCCLQPVLEAAESPG